MTQKQLSLALEWAAAAEALESAKAREKEARANAIKECFAEAPYGTTTLQLPRGYEFKAEIRPNYKANPELIAAALERLRATGEAGDLLAGRLVKFKADLAIGEFKKLTDDQRALVIEAIVVTPAAPALELVAPK